MLLVVRHPVLDLRSFADDDAVRSSVRLPPVWSEGRFVRSVGPVNRRNLQAIADWPSERCYTNFAGAMRFAPEAIMTLNLADLPLEFSAILRRMWSALPYPDCIFDFDTMLPCTARPPSYRHNDFLLSDLTEAIDAVVRLQVTIPRHDDDACLPSSLGNAGWQLAKHFAWATTHARHTPGDLVYSSSPVVLVDVGSRKPILNLGKKVDRYELGDVEVLSFRRGVRIYVVSTRVDTKRTRALAREIRVHLLRLHSIATFLERLVLIDAYGRHAAAVALQPEGAALASQPGDAYDALQAALRQVLRIIQRGEGSNQPADSISLISTTLRAHQFLTNHSLEALQARLLTSARPALRAQLRTFAQEERQRYYANKILEGLRDRSGVLNIYGRGAVVSNYDMHGSFIGAAGENASATNFTQSGTQNLISIGGYSVDQFQLVADLNKLRRAISSGESDNEVQEAQQAILAAEGAARAGDAEGVSRALSNTGKWLLRVAESIGVGVAVSAIKGALGL